MENRGEIATERKKPGLLLEIAIYGPMFLLTLVYRVLNSTETSFWTTGRIGRFMDKIKLFTLRLSELLDAAEVAAGFKNTGGFDYGKRK